jgi:hypothetical protein
MARAALIAAGLLALGVGLLVEERQTQPAAAARPSCARPYADASPWNVPIGRNPNYDPRSRTYVSNFGEKLTSDPTQYTYPVYEVGADASRETVKLSGLFSNVTRNGVALQRQTDATIRLPIPSGARASSGSDSSIVIVDRATGDEWGIWQLKRDGRDWSGTNGYHYSIHWSGVPPTGFGSRGAGVPYLAGLVRPCEIKRGRIEHALAFAYDFPTPEVVYPATKSDGKGKPGEDVPEGARVQLDPSLSAREIRRLGCIRACLTIARALQRYGMYVIDNSGRPKIMLEDEGTARWNGIVSEETVEPIPMSAFRVLTLSCVVPHVRGRTLAAARTLVRLAQCRLAGTRRVRRGGSGGDRVVGQVPAPGTRGAAVTLLVGR